MGLSLDPCRLNPPSTGDDQAKPGDGDLRLTLTPAGRRLTSPRPGQAALRGLALLHTAGRQQQEQAPDLDDLKGAMAHGEDWTGGPPWGSER